MANNYSHQDYPPPVGPPKPAKPHWLLYVIGAIVVLFLLQKVGCGPLRTEEKVEWIDR